MTSVSSFDIFDTLLTRALASPAALFQLLGRAAREKGLISSGPCAFARARVAAEQRANRLSDMPEAPLASVYRELAHGLGLSDLQRDALRDLELSIEAALLRPVPAGLCRLEDARRRGDRIAFLSDMYLPEAFLREQLQRIGAWRDGDTLIVSSVCGQTKGSGGMFRHASTTLNVPVSAIRHLGNSVHADVRGPQRAGAHGELLDDANPNRFERLLDRHTDATDGLASVLGGASKLARLHAPPASSRDDALIRVSAGVIGPVLAAFCLWTLRRAQAMGLRRLYFVSRDGEVLLRIARGLNERLRLPIDLRYLHGSRQSWHLPSVTALTDREFLWLLERTEVSSVRRVCSRVEIDPGAIREVLISGGFAESSWDTPLDAQGLNRLRAVFETDAAKRVVLERAAAARALAQDYFRQEGLFDDDRWAMVDVGWRARLQSSLALVLGDAGGPRPKGLYFGLNDKPNEAACGPAIAYLYDRQARLGLSGAPTDLSTHMEMFCCATHGTVRGYSRQNGRVQPVLKHAVNDAAMRWGLETVRQTVDRFVEHLVLDPQFVDLGTDLRSCVVELLRELSYRPTSDEARAYGAFDFASDQSEDHFKRFARAYGPIEGFRTILPPRLQSKRADVRWPAGSIELSPGWFRPVLRRLFRARLRLRDRFRVF